MAELSDKRAKIIKADNIIAHNANLEFETATLHSVVRELKDELAAREKQLRIVRKAEIGWAAAQKQESPKGGANSAFAAYLNSTPRSALDLAFCDRQNLFCACRMKFA